MSNAALSRTERVDLLELPLGLPRSAIEELGRIIDELREKTARRTHVFSREGEGRELSAARTIYNFRRLREEAFGPDLFADPAWDILLDLFIAAGEKKRISISSACIASSAPATTALRHLNNLVGKGFVAKRSCDTDARVTWVELTPEGEQRLARVLRTLVI